MAEIRYNICDRCKNKINDKINYIETGERILRSGTWDANCKVFELCEDCVKKLFDFLERNSND